MKNKLKMQLKELAFSSHSKIDVYKNLLHSENLCTSNTNVKRFIKAIKNSPKTKKMAGPF